MDLTTHSSQLLWIGSLTAAPLAILVCIASRWPGCRPATRHAMWLAVIASFITPFLTSFIGRPAWFQSGRILEACRGLLDHPSQIPTSTSSVGTTSDPLASAGITVRPSIRISDTSSPPSTHLLSSRAAEVSSPRSAADVPEIDGACSDGLKLDLARTLSECSTQQPRFESPLIQLPDFEALAMASRPVPPSTAQGAEAANEPAAHQPQPMASHDAAHPSVTSRIKAGDGDVQPAFSTAPAAVEALPVEAGSASYRAVAGQWLATTLQLRDQWSAVPPLPVMLWGVGAGLMLLAWLIRIIAMQRILARARPARDSMIRLVDSCAAQAGLSRMPLTLETTDRLSPMIVCGLRPTLILPIALWKDLDEESRRAVVLHELAHLRRHDHRTAWLVAFVGLVYWWNPVLWWARRRINEEADTCCDAWVTNLLPEGRRAYARALLATKSFLSLPQQQLAVRCAPPGLGVMSGGAKRLARRITMVLTQRTAPRSSVLGAATALMIAAMGTFVLPGLACPPSEQPEHPAAAARAKTRTIPRAASPFGATVAGQSDSVPGEFFGEAPALEAMKARGALPSMDDAGSAADAAKSLERAILELERRLEKMESGIAGQQATRPRATRNSSPGIAPGLARGPATPAFPTDTIAPLPALRGTFGTPSAPSPAPAVRLFGTSPANVAVIESSGVVARTYILPSGKLEALTDLMRRDDVPIFIEPGNDRIVVNATPAQHETFAAFIEMIHPSDGSGTAAYRAAPAQGAAAAAQREYNEAMSRYRSSATTQKAQIARMQEQVKQLEARQKNLGREAEKLQRRAERAQEQSSRLEEQADQIEERLENATDAAARERLNNELEAARRRQRDAQAQADAYEASADQVEASAEQMDEQIDAMNEQIEALSDALEQAADEQATADAAHADHAAHAPRALEPAEFPQVPAAPGAPAAPEVPAAPEAPEFPEAAQPAEVPMPPSAPQPKLPPSTAV